MKDLEFTRILGNTEQEQIDKAKELLELPTPEGMTTAGKLQMIMDLLYAQPEIDEDDFTP